MHLEVLVEDQSGSILVEKILDKINGQQVNRFTFRIHKFKGSGKLPHELFSRSDPQKRILLDRLPLLLRGYGKSLDNNSAVIVVVDNDTKNCRDFKQELQSILASCNPAPNTAFCIAIEEMEAWLLGDRQAVKTAYPGMKVRVLDHYVQDSICGTWEILADAVCREKASGLKKLGYPEIGIRKSEWMEKIAPNINLERNSSESFQYFVRKVQQIIGVA
ncbi:MAG TPA: DUF4276 family protein [Syntrophomonas sp.]|nr:DUF4276 family protein [Syntrophomonas sp.]HRW13342.1 DUF4276 family protein [Syntrophomonas sp.]